MKDASVEVSAMETGDKDLKIAKAFCCRGIFEFIFTDDVKTAIAGLRKYGTSLEFCRKGGGGNYRPVA